MGGSDPVFLPSDRGGLEFFLPLDRGGLLFSSPVRGPTFFRDTFFEKVPQITFFLHFREASLFMGYGGRQDAEIAITLANRLIFASFIQNILFGP